MNFRAGGLLLLLTMLVGLLAGAGAVQADGIRFYKVNDKGQQSEIMLIRKRDKPGCHNLRRSRTIFRVAQVGFVYCSVYAAKNCAEGSELTMHWKGRVKKNSARAQPAERLLPGAMWFFDDNASLKLRSWKCE